MCFHSTLIIVSHSFGTAKSETVPTFGSKAKLDSEDILDIGDYDSSLYLSDIDGPKQNCGERQPTIRSVIVKPDQIERISVNHSHQKKKRRIENIPLYDSRGSSGGKKAHGRVAAHSHTNTRIFIEPHVPNDTTSNVHVQTETRGTQTDRTGPCKCARQLKRRNQQKRSENKTNKQIVDTLERVNIIKFTD